MARDKDQQVKFGEVTSKSTNVHELFPHEILKNSVQSSLRKSKTMIVVRNQVVFLNGSVVDKNLFWFCKIRSHLFGKHAQNYSVVQEKHSFHWAFLQKCVATPVVSASVHFPFLILIMIILLLTWNVSAHFKNWNWNLIFGTDIPAISEFLITLTLSLSAYSC